MRWIDIITKATILEITLERFNKLQIDLITSI